MERNVIVFSSENNAERIKEITDILEQGVKDIYESNRYKQYLQVLSKFYNYSPSNALLIAMQNPDATLIAEYSSWKNKFERHVKKGEKGIKILAPSPYKVKKEIEKIDPNTQRPMIRNDGKPVMEEQEIIIPAYKIVTVFDVLQTDGKELPSIGIDTLIGNMEQYNNFFAALVKTSPVPVAFEAMNGNTKGYYHQIEKRIALLDGASQLQTLKTLIHEIAHAKLHDIDSNIQQEKQKRPDRHTRKVEAESIAYTVCQHYNLDTSDYSFAYIAGWSSGKESNELKSSLVTIRNTVFELTKTIDSHRTEIQKEQQEKSSDKVIKEAQMIDMELTNTNMENVVVLHQNEKDTAKKNSLTATENFVSEQKKLDPSIQPVVTIAFSESPYFKDDEQMSLFQANTLFQQYDKLKVNSGFYDKTDFSIVYTIGGELDTYEGRQDLGDGDGSLIDHIRGYHEYYANNEQWKEFVLKHDGAEELANDIAQRERTLNALIPYFQFHCSLSEFEQETVLQLEKLYAISEHDALDKSKIVYYEAIQDYINACRHELNTAIGEYHFPEMPKEQDCYTPELLAYQEKVKEEIKQEAEGFGMTVEEYAANNYEPLYSLEVLPLNETPLDTENNNSKRFSNTIDETAARHAKEANSFYSYQPGSATAEYNKCLYEAYQLAKEQKARVDPIYHEKIDYLVSVYSARLAKNMNESFSIESRVPSILITGGANFPVGKKEKQNQARLKNVEEWQEIQGILDKIRSTGMGGISADDPNAIIKLEKKLSSLEEHQKRMKEINAYYRKHKTLDRCPNLTERQIESMKAEMSQNSGGDKNPFKSFELSNNSAEIRRIKSRIEHLTQHKEKEYIGWEFDGGKVVANKAENRLQIFFDEKPDETIRSDLKMSCFRWSARSSAWQRQLNDNAIYACNYISYIKPITGETPVELQHKGQKETTIENNIPTVDEAETKSKTGEQVEKLEPQIEKKSSILAKLNENKEKIEPNKNENKKVHGLSIE